MDPFLSGIAAGIGLSATATIVFCAVSSLLWRIQDLLEKKEPRRYVVDRLVERVHVRPGEPLVLRCDERLTEDQHRRLSEWLQAEADRAGVKFVLLDSAVRVSSTGANP